jgi:sodium/potassium/calcium exchanger 6
MNFETFGCERNAIESIKRYAQKNILISEYCSDNFSFINLVDMYYRSMDENAILIFLFICAVFPILFMCIAAVADKYLAAGMTDLAQKFKLSPAVAAMTLIAFANGAPDILASLGAAGKAGGAFIAVGSLFGAFVFSCTLVVSNVVWNSPGQTVTLPKLVILKELGGYLCSVVCVIIFGFVKTAGYPFIGCYLLIYVGYVVVSLYIEKLSNKEGEKDDLELSSELDHDNSRGELNIGEPVESLDANNNVTTEINITMNDEDEMDESENKNKGFFDKVCDEMFEEENTMLDNIVLGPLMLAGMFTNCYLDNPFMAFPFKFIIIMNSFVFMIYTLELAELSLLVLFIIGGSLGAIFLVLELIKVNKFYLEIFYEFLSVFAAIGWISIFSGLVIDFISFLAFYFSINEVILSSLLLSAGNTVGDYFGNAALAKNGEHVMALVAAYSGQIFNNFIGFSASLFAATKAGNTEFDIFALDYGKGLPEGEELPPPLGNYFLLIVLLYVFVTIVITLVFYFMNQFQATNKFTSVLVVLYASFFIISLVFGFFSRGV